MTLFFPKKRGKGRMHVLYSVGVMTDTTTDCPEECQNVYLGI